MRKLKELTKEEEQEICLKRQNGLKRKDIIKEYGISDRHYQKVIIKNGGELNERTRKFNFDENYFEDIDTEDKAYFLGFIVADGSVNKKTLNISQKEPDILYEFKRYINFEGKVLKSKGRDIHTINLYSEKTINDLYRLGIYSNKTMIVKYPEIPKDLEHHFMRGLFDGDGCISIHKKRQGGRDTTDRGQVNICSGSRDFIEEYVERLNKYCGITKNKIRCPKGTYNVIDWASFSDIERFYDFFYKDATIYLKRKKETFDMAISISKSKTKYRKKKLIKMSVISYFGGKANFQSFITPIIPKDCKTYVEPFSGSFAIYLDSKLEFENVIFNDRNRHQANLMQCCSRPEEFLVELKKLMDFGGLLYTTETELDKKWDFYKAIYRTYITNDFLDNMDFEIGDLEVGAIYAFLITSSFSSVYPRGGGFTGFKKKTNKLNLQILINKLEKNKYTERLQNINEFNNLDFEEVITMHDAEDTYMYLDPPYARFNDIKNDDDGRRLFWYGCDTENTFGVSSHRRLLELLKKSKCRWSLSYYYFPLLEELLPKDEYFWTSKEFHRPSAVIKNKVEGVDKEKGIELLIMNYNPETGEKIKVNSDVQQSEPEWDPFRD